jgi:low temperature requirement protein LtrA
VAGGPWLVRGAYTYLHLPIVPGIIMVAVADDLRTAHPLRRLSSAGVLLTILGPAAYLLGETLVRLRMIRTVSLKRLLAGLGLWGYEPGPEEETAS